MNDYIDKKARHQHKFTDFSWQGPCGCSHLPATK